MTAPSPAAAALPAEDVERVARALWESCYGGTWDLTWEEFRDTPGADPGHYRRLAAAALAEMRPTAAEEAVKRVEAEREELRRLLAIAGEQLEGQRGARRVASESADRFRDVLAEALGHADENPGDDVLVAQLRAHFGKTGPEPTRWRDFLTGAQARLDQIQAMPDPIRRAPDGTP